MALVVEVDHSLKIFLLVLEVAGLVYQVFLVVSSLHVLFDRLHRVCELDLNEYNNRIMRLQQYNYISFLPLILQDDKLHFKTVGFTKFYSVTCGNSQGQ